MAGEEEKKESLCFTKNKHICFCLRTLQVLPESCDWFDSTRLIIAFFAVSSLDLMNALPSIEHQKNEFIEWIYYLQVVPEEDGSNRSRCGFRGSTPCTVKNAETESRDHFDEPSVAMTYAALSFLLILGDDLKRVDKESIICSLKELQLPDGSFRSVYDESESDMRLVYCASCICYILQDWSGMDVEKTVNYIQESYTYEGAIAQGPGLEAHGGSTFCAIASLWLMGRLETAFTSDQLKRLQRWCVFRQLDGFQGRPNKPTDSCYSFWIGATLKILGCYNFVDKKELRNFLLSTQDQFVGGISKWVDHASDPLHTFLGISGLSLMESDDLLPVHPALTLSQRAASFLSDLHEQWAGQR